MRLRLISTGAIVSSVCSIVAFGQDFPRADLFLGYSFVRANSSREIPSFTMNGGVGTLGLNINKYIGFEFEFGGYHNGNINNVRFDTTTMTYLFGPRFSLGREKKVAPYFHTLFGGMHLTTSIAQEAVPPVAAPLPTTTPPASGRYAASQDNFAMALGGGLDVKLSRLITFRPVQLDYLMTRFQDFGLSGQPSQNRNQHNLRYAAGFAFTFGGEQPAPPPPPVTTKACPGGITVAVDEECPKKNISLGLRVDKSDVCAGTTIMVTPETPIPSDATAQWTVNGEPSGQVSVLELQTGSLSPGIYKVALKVGGEVYNEALAETTVTVRGYQPPSGSVQVSPPEIWVGEKAKVMASFRQGECGGPLGPLSFNANEGEVSADSYDSSAVRFDPAITSEQQKTVTISASVSDGKQSASAQTQIVVKKKAALLAKRLPDVVFALGSDRVNNCGKRVLLEELKAVAASDPTGTVVFVGHRTDNESKWPGLDEKRALNAAAVISAGQGICTAFPAGQIQVSASGAAQNGVEPMPNFCGASAVSERPGQQVSETDETAKYRRVEVWFVPTGGVFPASVAAHQTAAALSVGALGCPK
jgi:hypothetical protein